MKAFLGLDTSCYTTSVAFAGEAGDVLAAERRLLSVPQGGRGLRQQEMVFQHVGALPELYRAAVRALPQGTEICAAAASTRPRGQQGSYMPAFTVGEGFGRVLADTLGIPLIETDHQAGHIAAGRVESGLRGARHMALHMSGGTSELLACEGEDIRLLGGTLDISAGQLVDRVGVALSLPFPAGPSLESAATAALERRNTPSQHLGVVLRGMDCSISGAEAQAMRDIAAGTPAGEVALSIYAFLARLTARLLAAGREATGMDEALLVGGVASSALYRRMLLARLEKEKVSVAARFALPELSGDNAVGVALIARDRHAQAESKRKEG